MVLSHPTHLLYQEDVVMGTLTVRENLRFSAALRLPVRVSEREKEARVNHLVAELGLAKVADCKVDDEMIEQICFRRGTGVEMFP